MPLNRKTPPPFSSPSDFNLPAPEVAAISEHTHLVQLTEVQQDVIKIEFLFKCGKWHEAAPGIAHFTAQLLDKGIPGKNAYQIASWFDHYGASIEINAGLDFTSVSLYALASNVHQVLPCFYEVLSQPTFPANELQLAKDIFSQNLKVNLEKTSFVANRQLRLVLFGESHPYGGFLGEEHLPAITEASLHHFFETNYQLFEVYVTGKLPAAAGNSLVSFIASSQKKNQTNPITISGNQGPLTDVYIEKQGAVQTSIRLAKRTINRQHVQYPRLILLNHILGGYFGSRLMKNIREEKGLTYGIHSGISTYLHDAIFSIATDVNKQNTQVAIEEVKKELSILCSNPISETELYTAKNHLLGNLQLEIANPFSIMEKIKSLRSFNLHPQFYTLVFNSIKSSTSSELLELARQAFNPNDLLTVAVG
ncbi:MAG: insulinase family protein [Cyclobacteriaceae bacterium]|nr:insulinase family protein [Cyclobacteriaceae bacterium]